MGIDARVEVDRHSPTVAKRLRGARLSSGFVAGSYVGLITGALSTRTRVVRHQAPTPDGGHRVGWASQASDWLPGSTSSYR